MSSTGDQQDSQQVSIERLKLMAELAGLNMTDEEVEEIKPLFDLHYQYAKQLHDVDLGAEEIAVSFEADWPE
ncbi:MAG TPA: hypothetical protein EYM65_11790 [Dehalococcoidia bacterium]|jgi:Asp-tRNA(Asn)/Glu-tRNA(Gln) amidotransferase C subunit|nr:hypothetical protein [Dehalococcoidia bacterium]